MDIDIDHYAVLGLPSGEEGAKLAKKEISKAYRLKALELHPDKRPDDPHAHVNFQKLKTSYEILKDEKARKLFDDLLRMKLGKLKRQAQQHSKRRNLMSDLEQRERAAFDADTRMKAREEEDRIARKLKEEISRIRSMSTNKPSAETAAFKKATKGNTYATTSPLSSNARNSSAWKNVKPDAHQAFENSVLEKLKAAQEQK